MTLTLTELVGEREEVEAEGVRMMGETLGREGAGRAAAACGCRHRFAAGVSSNQGPVDDGAGGGGGGGVLGAEAAVSYTHLTLPTSSTV